MINMAKYNLDRFLQAQEHAYSYALEELKAGRKKVALDIVNPQRAERLSAQNVGEILVG